MMRDRVGPFINTYYKFGNKLRVVALILAVYIICTHKILIVSLGWRCWDVNFWLGNINKQKANYKPYYKQC